MSCWWNFSAKWQKSFNYSIFWMFRGVVYHCVFRLRYNPLTWNVRDHPHSCCSPTSAKTQVRYTLGIRIINTENFCYPWYFSIPQCYTPIQPWHPELLQLITFKYIRCVDQCITEAIYSNFTLHIGITTNHYFICIRTEFVAFKQTNVTIITCLQFEHKTALWQHSLDIVLIVILVWWDKLGQHSWKND